MRSYVRQRAQLIRDRSRAVQHLQKALTQMNVQLDNVLSDIMGKTGQLIVRAIVAGERDGAALAKFRDGRCKADETTIAASLRGNWRGEHLFALQQALARHDMLQGQIEACEARIDSELDGQAPGAAANEPSPARRARESVVRERLHRMLGADLTAIPTVGVETALTGSRPMVAPPASNADHSPGQTPRRARAHQCLHGLAPSATALIPDARAARRHQLFPARQRTGHRCEYS